MGVDEKNINRREPYGHLFYAALKGKHIPNKN
jgi:hypothetical protein